MVPAFLVRFVAVGLWLPVLFAVPAHGQKQFLTPEQIAEAIVWGWSAQPDPYVLRSAFIRNKTPPGVVYTPYLRVALAARAAADQGREFTVEDVTAEMTAPLIYFAIGDYGADPLPAPWPTDTPLSMRLITEHSDPGSPSRRVTFAVWLRREIPDYLQYELRPDWSYALGAFPITHVQADSRIELYRERREGSNLQRIAAPGLVSEADLRAWK